MNRQTMLLTLLSIVSSAALANDFHPDTPLLDGEANLVLQSGKPLSTIKTCGACHDTAFITASSDHAEAGAQHLTPPAPSSERHHPWQLSPGHFGGWDPLRYDSAVANDGTIDLVRWLKLFGSRHVGGGPAAELVEMDCLLCHSDITDHQEREALLQSGDFEWANSTPLMQRNVVRYTDAGWQWNRSLFQADGSLQDGLLDIRKPRDENCGQCHGQVDNSLDWALTVQTDPARRTVTDRTGQIFSPQKLSNSGLNLADKASLNRPFDVHSDRVVSCVNCHYSLNNPVYFQQREESRPTHLAFDPRRLTSADYLKRPLHQFAKGKATLGLAAVESENSLRRCESCHSAAGAHAWLPYQERHFDSLSCESCHIPTIHGPALQSLDWTLVDREGQPRREYRNVSGDPASADSLIEGYQPLLLAREDSEGARKLAPFNLVTSWYWTAGNPARPVAREALLGAFYPDGELHPELKKALDSNRDDHLSPAEQRLGTQEQADTARDLLMAGGLEDVRIVSEITPFSISHNVVSGKWATRDCATCHSGESILAAPMTLSSSQPGGVPPTDGHYPEFDLSGTITSNLDGSAAYIPNTQAAGFYIIGVDGIGWIDLLGVLMFVGISLGVSGHALARYYFYRKRAGKGHHTHRVYMYDTYERLWHWLQAIAILLLLATGLIIHKPHIFGMFSFAYIVQVHNVLGFILLTNAALALFYNLASGEIHQYLPEPEGFVGRSLMQAMYYSRGIFAGRPHPLEKTKEHKLNPLQQVTYLAILTVLLPAQIVTGVLIWGLQEWPLLAESLGGLQLLAPIHTLIAWTFATFIVMHVYLTTAAGETPGAGIKSMVNGWEDVEDFEGDHP